MADPRLTLDFEGQHAKFMTFKIDDSTITYSATSDHGSAQVGLAVTFTTAGDGTIKLTEDGEFVLGRLCSVSTETGGTNEYATVQIAGAMKLPAGDSATLTEGSTIVGDLGAANAKGYVRSAASGTAAELVLARGFVITDGADSDGNHQVYL